MFKNSTAQHSLVTKLLLALSLIPTGILAGCNSNGPINSVQNTSNSSSNIPLALQNLETLHQQNITQSAEIDNSFGKMCTNTAETISQTHNGYRNIIEPETRIEPACMDWERGAPVNSLGMERALSTISANSNDHSAIEAFAAVVNRAVPVLLISHNLTH